MNDYKPKPGDIAFYLEGENLVLGVEILEVLLDKEKEAYKLKINEVLREGESRFTRNIFFIFFMFLIPSTHACSQAKIS